MRIQAARIDIQANPVYPFRSNAIFLKGVVRYGFQHPALTRTVVQKINKYPLDLEHFRFAVGRECSQMYRHFRHCRTSTTAEPNERHLARMLAGYRNSLDYIRRTPAEALNDFEGMVALPVIRDGGIDAFLTLLEAGYDLTHTTMGCFNIAFLFGRDEVAYHVLEIRKKHINKRIQTALENIDGCT